MKDDDLKQLFDDIDHSTASPEARKRALNLAMAAYDQAQEEAVPETSEKKSGFIQGLRRWFRPTGEDSFPTRRNKMTAFEQKWLYSGMAGAFVLVLAVSIFIYQPRIGVIDRDFPAPVTAISKLDDRKLEERVAGNREAEGQASQTLGVERGAGQKPAEPVARDLFAGKQLNEEKRQSLPESSLSSPEESSRDSLEDTALARTEREVVAEPARMDRLVQPSTAPSLQKSPGDADTRAKREVFAMADRAQMSEQDTAGMAAPVGKVAGNAAVAQSRILVPVPPAAEQPVANVYQDKGRDRFEEIETNPVKRVADEPVSTFSIDVDTASYSFVRRQLNQGLLPQKDAVRVEEMLNYFDYAYPVPRDKSVPFEPTVLVSDSPWKAGNKLVQIGIKGYDLAAGEKPRTNLVFLLDVSGSMNSPDKLPLVIQSMNLLLSQLQPEDSIGIVVYAGAAGTVLEPTPVREKQKIMDALNRLRAGGSTAGAQGIKLAYQLAESNFDKNAVNRIILATDGDFNVGITNREELKGFVERKREKGIFLSVLGFGQGNYHDHMMQVLAQNGNGVAAYIDTLSEAQKVLVDEATSTLFTIARDVKIQVEFNPATVSEYRLLGYETRHLKREDFNNDAVDAGDIGAGHSVTAIYEITPVGSGAGLIDDSRYAPVNRETDLRASEYGYLKMRYKLPEATTSKLLTRVIPTASVVAEGVVSESDINAVTLTRESGFATAVAGFAQLLRGGQYTGTWSYDDAINLAQANKGEDPYGYRTELVQLIRKAKSAAAL